MNKKILFSGILVLIFSFIGCDQGIGTSPESVGLSTVDFNTDGSGYAAANPSDSPTIPITVTLSVQNAGSLYSGFNGIVSTEDDSYLVKDFTSLPSHFTVIVDTPINNTHLNIRYAIHRWFYEDLIFIASLPLTRSLSYYTVLDLKESSPIVTVTENNSLTAATLADQVFGNDNDILYDSTTLGSDFDDAWNRALHWDIISIPTETKDIEVEFIVRNGGPGIWETHGIVSSQDDSILEIKDGFWASNYTIKITVPKFDTYLNIRWYSATIAEDVYLKGKLDVTGPGYYSIILDYNGGLNVEHDLGLYDVTIGGFQSANHYDFYNAEKRCD